MEHTQPNRTLTNIADDLEQLAARADHLVPSLPKAEARILIQELCDIRGLISEATSRLRVLQAQYPEQLESAG